MQADAARFDATGNFLQLQHGRAEFVRGARVDVLHLAADHEADEVRHASRGHVVVERGRHARRGRRDACPTDRLAVTQHGVALADALTLFEEVADVDHAHAARAQAFDHGEKPLRIHLREAARRLVHDEQLRLAHERAGDFHELLLRDGQGVDRRGEREVGVVELLQCAAGEIATPGAVQPAEARGLFTEQNVFLHAQVGREVELLVNHRDAALARVQRVRRAERLAIERDASGVGLIRAGEDFHQRAFARAVLADERVRLAGCDGQCDAPQRVRGTEGLAHAGHFEAGLHARRSKLQAPNPKGRRAALGFGIGSFFEAWSLVISSISPAAG